MHDRFAGHRTVDHASMHCSTDWKQIRPGSRSDYDESAVVIWGSGVARSHQSNHDQLSQAPVEALTMSNLIQLTSCQS